MSCYEASSLLSRSGLGPVLEAVVDGSEVAGNGAEQVVIDPATGRGFASFRDASEDLVSRAVVSAARARLAWGVNDGTRRAALLLRITQKGVEALRHYTQLKTVIVELGDDDG
jgi:acyl-CoA reductase-like NAD-dependent aldehyde dehydrogenase